MQKQMTRPFKPHKLMTAMMFAGAPFNGEMTVVYNYVRSRYGWDAVDYSNYSTFKSIVSIIGG